MSFMDNLQKLAGEFLNNDPNQAAQAASDHVNDMDPNELAGHLTQSVGSLDGQSLGSLGQQLLQSFDGHPASPSDGATAAQDAGTSAEAVAAGDPNAVSALIAYAKANPQVLQSAASAFMQRNPGALTQLAPGLLQGIMGRLGGGAASSGG